MKATASVVLGLLLVLWTAPAHSVVVADYLGYGYETGGFLPSDAGDELVFTCVSTWVDPVTGADLTSVEVTIYVYGLISDGETVDGSGNTIVTYTGGKLEMYVDPSQNADWGTNPPNATTPTTFSDGILLFEGDFTSFVIGIQPDGSGVYEGSLDGLAGTMLDSGCADCGYTWGGAWTVEAGAQIPAGYDLQVDGKLDVLESVSSREESFGSLKADFHR